MRWPNGAEAIPCDAFDDVVERLARGDVDAAVLPVFNVIAGNVQAALAAIADAGTCVTTTDSLRVPIEMCLMALPGATLESVRIAYSHSIALAQCSRFFSRLPHIVPRPHADTAGAAREVASRGDVSLGAIAGEAAAIRYGLNILERAIQDVPDNWTRFIVLVRAT